jgi:hypothetical protein
MSSAVERRCASIKSLTEIKDVGDSNARTIRAVFYATSSSQVKAAYSTARDRHAYENFSEYKRAMIDQLLGTFGIEELGVHARNGQTIRYCNTGEMYAPTVVFYGSYTLTVTDIGSLVERNLVRAFEQL